MGKRRHCHGRFRASLLVALTSTASIAAAWFHISEISNRSEATAPAFTAPLATHRARTGSATARRARAVVPTEEESKDLVGISTQEEFEANIAADLVVAMFSSPYCGPCMLVEPMIGKMAQDFKENLKIIKVNLIPGQTGKALKPLFSEHSVKELPTFIVFKDGEAQGRVTGTRHAELRKMIEELV
mmetsp:Transcript_78279/g.242684  ORF Transcript_78279/g.242684 Transcript_78279/m.242684 type:complete len:186 (-) Transcript_78279:194-751(-)